MKQIVLTLAAIICLATSAMAQISESQTLSTTLWKQGIATCAHYTAYARGFGKRAEEIKSQYPQGYTLDDLNNVYENQGRKWEKIYNEFKEEEDKNGSINDLKELVTPQIWKLVEPEFQAYITEHPEAMQELPPQPAQENAENDGNAEEKANDEAAPATANAKSGMPACSANLPLWLSIIGALLGLCALLTALSNRGKIKEMRRNFARELDRTNANLQEFSADAADQMRALSIRLTGKAIRKNDIVEEAPAEEKDAVIEEEPQAQAEETVEQEAGEPMTLFLSKPDENDDFTRVSDAFEPGNSLYVLNTEDGVHGTFEVIDKPEVHRMALMMPTENLIRACSGNAIQIPSGNRIITDRAGEAEFINGKWHVAVKAIIHYEG